jgi:hypothetical protein
MKAVLTTKSIGRIAALAIACAAIAVLPDASRAQLLPGPGAGGGGQTPPGTDTSPRPGADAQTDPNLINTKIGIAYLPPKTSKHHATLQKLKSWRYLEQLSEFLAPLRLPHPFYLVTDECGDANAYYSSADWWILLCYEWIELMHEIAPKPGQPEDGVTNEDVVIGETVATVLHEIGHGVFDMLRVPLFGREEDAADQLAIFVALQFSPDIARRIVVGDAYFWSKSENPRDWAQYAGEHGTAAQRFYNTLCLAYGFDPKGYKDFVEDKKWLPPERAANCEAEYKQVANAFTKTVLPFIDQGLMQKVRKRNWLRRPGEAERP